MSSYEKALQLFKQNNFADSYSLFKKISLDESLAKMINYVRTKGNKKFKYNYDLEIINEKTPRTWVEKKF